MVHASQVIEQSAHALFQDQVNIVVTDIARASIHACFSVSPHPGSASVQLLPRQSMQESARNKKSY